MSLAALKFTARTTQASILVNSVCGSGPVRWAPRRRLRSRTSQGFQKAEPFQRVHSFLFHAVHGRIHSVT